LFCLKKLFGLKNLCRFKIYNTTGSNVFFNNPSNGKIAPSGDNIWKKSDMTYWSLQAGDQAWWSSTLIDKQKDNLIGQSNVCDSGIDPIIYSACSHSLGFLL